MDNTSFKPGEIKNIDFEIYEKQKFFNRFTFYDESELLQKKIFFKIGDNKKIANIIEEFKIQTGIMISKYKFNETNIYIFIFDEIILLTNQTNLEKYRLYFSNHSESLLFFDENSQKYFSYFMSKRETEIESKFNIKNDNNNEIKNKLELEKRIMSNTIKKSQILTIKNRHKINQKKFDVNKNFNYNDFIIIKRIPKHIDLCYNTNDQLLYILKWNDSIENYQHEIDFYKHFNRIFPYISNMFGKTKNAAYEYIVLEYIEGETLKQFISNNQNIEMAIKYKIIIEILFSVCFIHSNGFFLRDLKWDNIIIDSNFNAILIDFDCSKKIQNKNEEVNGKLINIENKNECTSNIGDYVFAAPEQRLSNNYTSKVDSYSIGIIIHFIITGSLYDIKTITHKYLEKANENNTNHSKIVNKYDDFLKEYQNCFEISPDSRPKIIEIINNFVYHLKDTQIKKYLPNIIEKIEEYHIKYNIIFNSNEISYFLGNAYYRGEYITFNINKSIYYLTLSSNQNNSDAQYFLGVIYYYGKCVTRDINKSIYYLTLSANLNNSDAQLLLGSIYYCGEYITRNINKAIYYFTLSANQNNSEAQNFLGSIYYCNEDVARDINKSIYYFTLSSNQNNSDSQYALGLIYYFEGITHDIKKSIYYFTLSSNQNNSNAQCFLGLIYYDAKYVIRDINKSIYYLTLASNQNNSDAQYLLGEIYYKGEYISRDINKSIHYLKLSSNQYNPDAQSLLGLIYYNGKYIARDINKSIHYLIFSSNQNNSYAQCLLGLIYYKGEYIARDINKSIYFLTLSSNQNNSDAQYYLGLIYYDGEYIERDINKSIHYLTLAANQNDSNAQYLLGKIYYKGEFVTRDINKSIHYFKESSCFYNSLAKNYLGIIYKNGDGVEKNIFNSIIYFEEAIKEKNYEYAMYNLSRIYYFGIDIERNIPKSIELLKQASENKLQYADLFLFYIYSYGYEHNKYIKEKNYYKSKLPQIIQDFFISDNQSTIERLQQFLKQFDLYFDNDKYFYFIYFMTEGTFYKEDPNSNEPKNKYKKDITKDFYHGLFND